MENFEFQFATLYKKPFANNSCKAYRPGFNQ